MRSWVQIPPPRLFRSIKSRQWLRMRMCRDLTYLRTSFRPPIQHLTHPGHPVLPSAVARRTQQGPAVGKISRDEVATS